MDQLVNYSSKNAQGEEMVKIICLGDSAVGKSKLVERFLMKDYQPQQLSTFALTKFEHHMKIDNRRICIDFWDTAGQERFASLHPSYYHQAHACILVFDVMRKPTYKNLSRWYDELRSQRKDIPCICAANKIDMDPPASKRPYKFVKQHHLPLYFVSASSGANVVKLFKTAVTQALDYKRTSTDAMDLIMEELEYFGLDDAAAAQSPSTGASQNSQSALAGSGDSGVLNSENELTVETRADSRSRRRNDCDSGIDSAGSFRGKKKSYPAHIDDGSDSEDLSTRSES